MMARDGESPAPRNTPAWAVEPWRSLPRLDGTVRADVCVVGLGGSGLACVNELLRLGRSVVGIDAGSVGGAAAGRNGGFLLAGLAAFYHNAIERLGHERARALYALTMSEIERMSTETPDAVRRTGSLRLAASPDEESDCRRHLEALRADGFPASWYDGPEGPGVLIESDGAFNPLQRCRHLADQASNGGARLFECSAVEHIDGRDVHTARGRVSCGAVIVAVDGALDRVLPELADRVRVARLQMIGTAPAPEVVIPRPVYARWGLDYWQQLPDHRVVLGGFRDVGGEDEWTHDSTPTAPVQEALEHFLRDRLGVTATITHRWAASVGYTTTALPVFAEVRPSVWAIGAYSGTGNVVGALCGRAVARRATGAWDDVARWFAA